MRARALLWTLLVAVVAMPPTASAQRSAARGPAAAARHPMRGPLGRRTAKPNARAYRKPFQADPTHVRRNRKGAARFAIVGDAGSAGPRQHAIARELRAQYRKRPFDALLLAGDNVYERGELPRMPDAIYRPYAPLFEAGVRALPVLGNHDIKSDGGHAQMRYFGLGKRRFYKTRLAKGQVELFAIDTTLLLPGKNYYPEGWRAAEADKQSAWLERELAASTARFKIVMGHHPLYFSSTGYERELVVRDTLEKTLVDHGVAAYISGHHHHYERSKPIGGVTHIVSGGGGMQPRSYGLERPNPQRESLSLNNQFMLFELKGSKLHFSSIDDHGQTIDRGVLEAP